MSKTGGIRWLEWPNSRLLQVASRCKPRVMRLDSCEAEVAQAQARKSARDAAFSTLRQTLSDLPGGLPRFHSPFLSITRR
jgi:hypothetical protein